MKNRIEVAAGMKIAVVQGMNAFVKIMTVFQSRCQIKKVIYVITALNMVYNVTATVIKQIELHQPRVCECSLA